MRSASGALIAFLASATQCERADLFTLTLVGGGITRLTSADIDLVVGGQTYLSGGPRILRTGTKLTIGLSVDEMTLTVLADAAKHTLNGVPWATAAARGDLDGARVLVQKCYLASWTDTSAGAIILFSGRVSTATVSRNAISLPVKSDLELLNIAMPRNLYQVSCVHTLYDTGCGLARASFKVSQTVTAGSTASAILATGLTQATGYFDLGVIQFTSGALASLPPKTVKTYTNAAGVKTVNVASAYPVAPANGDGFDIYPGCDKLQATCSGKFNNINRFRGYPFVPTAEAAR